MAFEKTDTSLAEKIIYFFVTIMHDNRADCKKRNFKVTV